MEDELIQLLEALGFPVYRQGSITRQYDDSFFTFWNDASPDHSHYDDRNYGTAWAYSVYFYSVDADTLYAAIASARETLKANGWVVPGSGFDVQSDEKTHIGRGLHAYFLQV